MKRDDLGDRMKLYEAISSVRLMPQAPVIARLDGRCFSRFTRHAKSPYSKSFSLLMDAVTRHLVMETSAKVGYTQSDEVTLMWYSDSLKSQVFFDGKVQKMCSALAAMATAKLHYLRQLSPGQFGPSSGLDWHMLPGFDCRVFGVPSPQEAANALVWRQLDAARNSVHMHARSLFSHSQCLGKSPAALQEMMFQKFGVNWNDNDPRDKRGVFYRRVKVERTFTAEEIERLPAKHHARQDPTFKVERTDIERIDLHLTKIANRVAVLFNGAVPEYR